MARSIVEENIKSEKHIEEVCDLLKQAWLMNSKISLGKLISKMSIFSKSVVPYFMTDVKAIETLKQIIDGTLIIPVEQEIESPGPIVIEQDAKPKKVVEKEAPKKKRKSKEPKEEITDEDAEAIKRMNKALKKKAKRKK